MVGPLSIWRTRVGSVRIFDIQSLALESIDREAEWKQTGVNRLAHAVRHVAAAADHDLRTASHELPNGGAVFEQPILHVAAAKDAGERRRERREAALGQSIVKLVPVEVVGPGIAGAEEQMNRAAPVAADEPGEGRNPSARADQDQRPARTIGPKIGVGPDEGLHRFASRQGVQVLRAKAAGPLAHADFENAIL